MARLRRIDLDLEGAGVWRQHPDGWSVRVRSASSPRVMQALSAALQRRLGELGGESLPQAEQEKVLREVYASEVLVDWRDIDEAPTFSDKAAALFMSDPELRGFQDFVARAANEAESFERKGEAAILGNSPAGSKDN